MDKKIKKFNGGRGAVLCNNCRKIIGEFHNFTKEFLDCDEPVYCHECCEKTGMYPYIYKAHQRYLNLNLLTIKGISEKDIDLIIKLHSDKIDLYDLINVSNDRELFKIIAGQLQRIEFDLQEAWGFQLDARMHRFWETPKCLCPKMDNEDDYPSDFYHINGACPFHGN